MSVVAVFPVFPVVPSLVLSALVLSALVLSALVLVVRDAALPVKIDTKKRETKKLEVGRDIPGKDEIQRLLAASVGRHRPLIVTAVFTGLRASELCGLPWSAVDFEKRMITVRQRADQWGTIGMPKSAAGQREIPMSPTVLNTLREWRLACPI